MTAFSVIQLVVVVEFMCVVTETEFMSPELFLEHNGEVGWESGGLLKVVVLRAPKWLAAALLSLSK